MQEGGSGGYNRKQAGSEPRKVQELEASRKMGMGAENRERCHTFLTQEEGRQGK